MSIYHFPLLLLALFMIPSCNDDDPSPDTIVLSRWVLDEVLSDPGDGSGTFQPVESHKVVVFLSDNTLVIYEGTLCALGGTEGEESLATYSEAAGTITPANCDFTLNYTITQEELVIGYPCIEPCAEKYRKVLLRDNG